MFERIGVSDFAGNRAICESFDFKLPLIRGKQSQLQNKSLSKSPRAPKAHLMCIQLCRINAPHVYRAEKFSDCSRCDNVSWITTHRNRCRVQSRNEYFLQTFEFAQLIRSRLFLNKDVELISREKSKKEKLSRNNLQNWQQNNDI